MSKFVNESNFFLEPCDFFYGFRAINSVQTVADVADSLNDKYFTLEAIDADYAKETIAVWFNTGAGSAPAAGDRQLEVSITTGDSADAVATALGSALASDDSIRSASVSGDTVTITSERFGAAVAADVDSGFTIAAISAGLGGALGGTIDGFEVTIEEGLVDVVSDQTGAQILDRINNALNVSASCTFKEVTQELRSLMIAASNKIVGTGDEVLVGLGENKRFRNTKQDAGELIAKPVGSTNDDRTMFFWSAYPSATALGTFSGTDTNSLPIDFTMYRDASKDNKYATALIGDESKIA